MDIFKEKICKQAWFKKSNLKLYKLSLISILPTVNEDECDKNKTSFSLYTQINTYKYLYLWHFPKADFPSLTKWWSSQPGLQRLGHGQITPVSEGGLDQLVLYSQVLKAVVKLSVGHLNGQLLQHVRILWVKVEPHLTQPVKTLGIVHFVFH